MTPGEREEIERIAKYISLRIFTELNRDFDSPIYLPDDCAKWISEPMIAQIEEQVEKARAEERERCAKIAEMYVIEFGNTGMHFKTLHGDKIASAIRDKLEKE